MQNRQSAFITSLSRMGEYPGMGPPEIAMVGRSNVGKSSLINAVAGHKKLAKVSGEPGKTRLINVYSLGLGVTLIDLPGYGYAKVSMTERERWKEMIEGYFKAENRLWRVLQLVDIRHAPTRDDVNMVNWLRHYGIAFTVVATKADKLSKSQQSKRIPEICRTLVVQPWEVIPFSAQTGQGRDALIELMGKALETKDGAL